MSTKVARSFRLEKDVVLNILVLQRFYEDQLNIDLSQADVLKILVRNEIKSIDKNKLDKIMLD